jgi:hypothetical protein
LGFFGVFFGVWSFYGVFGKLRILTEYNWISEFFQNKIIFGFFGRNFRRVFRIFGHTSGVFGLFLGLWELRFFQDL